EGLVTRSNGFGGSTGSVEQPGSVSEVSSAHSRAWRFEAKSRVEVIQGSFDLLGRRFRLKQGEVGASAVKRRRPRTAGNRFCEPQRGGGLLALSGKQDCDLGIRLTQIRMELYRRC